MKRFSICCAAAFAALLAACSFSLLPRTDYTEPRTFDLATPAPIEGLPFAIETDSFSNECSGRYKMVFREKANEIEIDQYNRWSVPPGAMVTKSLAACFAMPPDNANRTVKPVFELDGSVLACEMNKEQKEVSLMVHYFITEPGNEAFRISGTKDYRIPVAEATPDAFADGLNIAISKFADQVVEILTKELKDRAAEAKAPAEKK